MDTATSPLTLDQALTEYSDVFLAARNLAHKTRIDYGTDVTQLPKTCKTASNVGYVLIRRGKGRKVPVISLNYKACGAVRSYLNIRPRDIITQGLFISKFKRPVTPRGIEWIVNKYF